MTWSCRPLTSALIFGSGERTAYGNTNSSGSTSSRQNSSTQSSFFWNSGSVEKSHATVSPLRHASPQVYYSLSALRPFQGLPTQCQLDSALEVEDVGAVGHVDRIEEVNPARPSEDVVTTLSLVRRTDLAPRRELR